MTTEPKTEDVAATRAQELLNRLWNDGSLGAQVRKKAKEAFPDIVLPEDNLEPALAPMREENNALKTQLEALAAKLAERETKEAEAAAKREEIDYEARLNKVRTDRHMTEDGFNAMIERMKATGNYTDPEAAAAWVMEQSPPPKPAGPYLGPQAANFYGTQQQDERFKLLHQSPADRFVDAELMEFINDPDAYVNSAGF